MPHPILKIPCHYHQFKVYREALKFFTRWQTAVSVGYPSQPVALWGVNRSNGNACGLRIALDHELGLCASTAAVSTVGVTRELDLLVGSELQGGLKLSADTHQDLLALLG